MSNQCIGILDQGYFVSRKEILKWINNTLKLELTLIQQLGSGAVYCQLLDSLCPGKIPMQKVNWRARQEYEFIQNFKVFQIGLDRLGVTKKIDIQKLSKCKYQDNLQLIQWLKRYIQLEGGSSENYNPQQRRNFVQFDLTFKNTKNNTTNKQNIKKMYGSTSNLLKSTDFRDYNTNNNDLSFEEPKRSTRKSLTNLHPTRSSQLLRVAAEPLSQRNTNNNDNTFNQIREIVNSCRNNKKVDSELEKIRKLLQIQQIDEQEQLDII